MACPVHFVVLPRDPPTAEDRAAHRPGMDAIAHIRQALPPLSVVFPASGDYPVVRFNAAVVAAGARWVAREAQLGREVFRIDDAVYFRRYDDDWNATVVYGSVPGEGRAVDWITNVDRAKFVELAKTV